MLDSLNEEKLMNIMDESFLNQLSWDDNNQQGNPRGEIRSSEITSTEEMVTTTSKVQPILLKDTIMTPQPQPQQQQQPPIKMQTAKVSQYQPIKPATSQQSHKQQKIQPAPTAVPSTIILTPNRQSIITTSSPTTTQILLQQNPTTTNYYNIKTLAPANHPKTKQPKSIQPAPASLPVMQLIQTSVGDKQQMLPTVMYTTTGSDGQNIQLAPILTTVPLVINSSDGEGGHFTIGSK